MESQYTNKLQIQIELDLTLQALDYVVYKELSEMRCFISPPPEVLKILHIVYILLGNDDNTYN